MKGAGDRFYFNEETYRQYFPAKEISKVISDRKRGKVWRQGFCLQIQVLVFSQKCLPV